jgi:hypothetical protein
MTECDRPFPRWWLQGLAGALGGIFPRRRREQNFEQTEQQTQEPEFP